MIRMQDTRRRPFGVLVAHFIRRLFASEEEQGSASLGFSIGAVLALVASPGAFASVALLGKYSSLIAWLSGRRLDAIRRSPSDEYFFILLSMTITGLIMVARWNRLFPDRRDFANLAILPLPVRNIFLANFAALLWLGVLFGVVVNMVSALLFPLFVTLSIGTLGAFVRVAFAHAVAVFGASLFSFFAVFALVGVLTLVLPRRIFRPVSLAMRIVLVVSLLCEFFGNVLVQVSSARTATVASWLPSYWFLGIYESMIGIAKPKMAALGEQAWFALGAAILISSIAYALCYRRVFARLPETFDMLANSRPFLHIRLPEILLRPLFRSPFERACSTFACKVLLRSEPHLMFFGAYLGVGLVIVAGNASPLAAPMLIAFFIASGLRFVFDTAAMREANWVFRMTSDSRKPGPKQIARRLMLLATLPWQFMVVLPLAAHANGIGYASLHVAFLAALTLLFTDALLLQFHKIPFTCPTQRDVRQLLNRMLVTVFGLLILVPALVGIERALLARPWHFVVMFLLLAAIWLGMRKFSGGEDYQLIFEDGPAPAFELLKLS